MGDDLGFATPSRLRGSLVQDNPYTHEKRQKAMTQSLIKRLSHGVMRTTVDAAGLALGTVGGVHEAVQNRGSPYDVVTAAVGGAVRGVAEGEGVVRAIDFLTGWDQPEFEDVPQPGNRRHKMAGTKKTKKSKSKSRRVPRGLTYAAQNLTELKHLDFYMNAITPSKDWQIGQLGFLPTQGTDSNNRIGRKVKVVRLDIICRLATSPVTGVAPGGDEVIMQVWQDKRTRGATTSLSDIYLVDSGGVNRTIRSLRNPDNLSRFKLITTHQHNVQIQGIVVAATPLAAEVQPAVIKQSIKVNAPFEFDAGGLPTIANVMTNSFCMTIVNVTDSANLDYDMAVRAWYTDY